MHRLGIIVPYRNRAKHLRSFIREISDYLDKKKIPEYRIIIAEQTDNKDFNRGALLNAGFLEAKNLGCDYVVFHDIDLIPRDVDYSYSDVPQELVGKVVEDGDPHFSMSIEDLNYDYFGGVTLFPVETFEKINGFSNKYIGWGFEDNDLLLRCQEAQVPLSYKNYRQYQAARPAFTFNGVNSYIKAPFLSRFINKEKGLSFAATFKVEDLDLNLNSPYDECAIFCIPGLDAALCYESYGTYKFEVFDNYEDVYSIHTEKYPVGVTLQAVVTFDFKKRYIKLYINGREVGRKQWPEGRYIKFGSSDLYLGVAHPTREIKSNVSRKWLKGQILDFAIFSRTLEASEINHVFRESFYGFNRFNPQLWYSGYVTDGYRLTVPNLSDVADGNTIGDLVDVSLEPLVTLDEFYRVTVPVNRGGVFVTQPHETNGTVDGYWKSWASRENQERYRNAEALGTFKNRDGLNSLQYIVETKEARETTYGSRVLVKFL